MVWKLPCAAAVRASVDPEAQLLRFLRTTYEAAAGDGRDGLTREERVVLHVLREIQMERNDRNIPTAMLWGRVCEHFYISPADLSEMLARLGARK